MTSKPSYHQQDEFVNRSQKLTEIKELGIDPFPHHFQPTYRPLEILEKFKDIPIGDSEQAAEGATPEACVAGRLILFRAMGKNAFAHLQSYDAKIQLMFNKDLTKVEGLRDDAPLTPLKFIEKKIDLGDLIGVQGNLFRTHKGEITLFVKKFTLLCKSLLPLPEKHSGLVDKEIRYRKRWLDLISHEEVRKVFFIRSRMLKLIRDFLHEHHFLEVETPVLQNTYGGAEARPFFTHIHATDQDMFLRISLEISLKKILVGGMERIYEIGKVFRNEGIDRTHNPEFTMLEAYAAYWDYNEMMVFVENLIEKIAKELLGTTEIQYSHEGEILSINVAAPWKRMSMHESIQTYASIDISNSTDEELKAILREKTPIDHKMIKQAPRGALIAMIFDELVSSKLLQPHHITDHPIETTPLCKLHRDPKKKKEGLVERFESFFLGRELCNSYTELNDPELQRKLLEEQALKKDAGHEEAHPLDEEFIEAVAQGMPPAAGIGIGIDRLAMLFTSALSIRDVLFFPIMKSSS